MNVDGRFSASVVNTNMPATVDPVLPSVVFTSAAVGTRCALVEPGQLTAMGNDTLLACPDIVGSVRRRDTCTLPPMQSPPKPRWNKIFVTDGQCTWQTQSLVYAMTHQLSLCATPADQSAQCYNEFTMSFNRIAADLPRVIEAVLVRPSTSSYECARAREVRNELLSEYGPDAADLPPLLLYDPTADPPFSTEVPDCQFDDA